MTSEQGTEHALHLRLGWWCVAVFALTGLLLEAMHGFKSGYLLDVGASTRRHMLTLAHAHGTLLGVINVAFAWTCTRVQTRMAWASRCLVAATIGVPVGFGLGGMFATAADPGLGILLVPPAGACLVIAAVLTARELRTTSRSAS